MKFVGMNQSVYQNNFAAYYYTKNIFKIFVRRLISFETSFLKAAPDFLFLDAKRLGKIICRICKWREKWSEKCLTIPHPREQWLSSKRDKNEYIKSHLPCRSIICL